jgi:hypothetical protein
MAAENDEQKGGDDEERRTGRDRRRPPLTIDLTAAPAPGKGPGAPRETMPPPPPPPGAKGAATPPPRQPPSSAAPPVGGWSNFARFAPQNMDRETWIGVGSAAALGGVVALLLLMLLQGIGIVPSPGASAARQAADQARAATEALASVDRRLTAMQAMTDGVPALRTDTTATAGRVATAEQALAALAANVQALRTDLTALRARIEQAAPSATPADVAAIAARVGRLEAALAAGAAPTAGAPATSVPVGDDPRIAALSSRLEAAEATIGRLTTTAPVATTAGTANARTVALANLRRGVDAGRPFAAELDGVAALGPDAVTAGLRPYAASGIATREALRADFSKVGDAILAATQGSDDSLFGRLVSGARGLVSVKPTAPIAGSDPPAIVSRMDAAVAKGDFATALREREALPAAGKAASADWSMKVAARIAAETLLADPTAVTGGVNP